MFTRLASRTSDSQPSNEPRVRLHPGNQHTVEELAQGISTKRKQEIEQLYEFEKLEINSSSATQDDYRHDVTRRFGCLLRSHELSDRAARLLGGRQGVFDLEDILQILRDERMRDICVIEIPPEQQYARYLVLATAFSARHLKSTSEYINKLVRAWHVCVCGRSTTEANRCV